MTRAIPGGSPGCPDAARSDSRTGNRHLRVGVWVRFSPMHRSLLWLSLGFFAAWLIVAAAAFAGGKALLGVGCLVLAALGLVGRVVVSRTVGR